MYSLHDSSNDLDSIMAGMGMQESSSSLSCRMERSMPLNRGMMFAAKVIYGMVMWSENWLGGDRSVALETFAIEFVHLKDMDELDW